jgi:hypothetical protein
MKKFEASRFYIEGFHISYLGSDFAVTLKGDTKVMVKLNHQVKAR